MNITIIGQGAIGLLWYSHLYLAKYAKQSINLDKLQLFTSPRDKGKATTLAFQSFDQQNQQIPLIRADKTARLNNNILLICVKSYQVAQVLTELNPLLGENSHIVLSHNGMGTLEELPSDVINRFPVYQLLTTHGCKKNNDFNITHTGPGFSDIGQVAGPVDSNNQQLIAGLLNTTMPEVNLHQDIITKQWLKLAINAAINPITAINNCDNGDIVNEQYQVQIKTLLKELIVIAKLEGINFDFNELYQQVLDVAEKTALNTSSMRFDVLNHQRTEIDYINGYIHRLGEKWQVATPENTRLWQQVCRLNQNLGR